jgi:hypothetical protein
MGWSDLGLPRVWFVFLDASPQLAVPAPAAYRDAHLWSACCTTTLSMIFLPITLAIFARLPCAVHYLIVHCKPLAVGQSAVSRLEAPLTACESSLVTVHHLLVGCAYYCTVIVVGRKGKSRRSSPFLGL